MMVADEVKGNRQHQLKQKAWQNLYVLKHLFYQFEGVQELFRVFFVESKEHQYLWLIETGK